MLLWSDGTNITSLQFGIFVAICLILYWMIKSKYQWILLLLASTVFYFTSAKVYTIDGILQKTNGLLERSNRCSLTKIHIENFKGIKSADFSFFKSVNLIIGNSGTEIHQYWKPYRFR